MSSLLARAVVLSFSRFASQAIILVSPLLLVRILPVEEYGKYREFLVYAGLVAAFVTLGIRHSLIYLIPRHPEQERIWITQATLYTLASSTIAVILIIVGSDFLRARTSFDFVTALQLYIIFFTNLDFIESYWLSKKRTDKVLYYSLTHLLARMTIVVASAVITEDAGRIISSLVAFEFLRCLLILLYASWRRWFTIAFDRKTLALQGSYFLPLGAGGVVELLNQRAGMLFISMVMGVEALAFFVIGAFAIQIVNVIRGAIADVIFPEIVSARHVEPQDSLPLWKKATVWYCILLFPIAVVFGYFSDAIVTVLFTESYAAAIPVFSIFALLLVLYCFDFHLPLRVQNANRYFMSANILALVVNLALIYPSHKLLGLVGPAVALVLSRLVFTVYLGGWATRVYAIRWHELVDWKAVVKVGLAAAVCGPILIAGKHIASDYLLRSVIFGGAYVAMYLVLLQWLRIWDVREFVGKVLRFRTSPRA